MVRVLSGQAPVFTMMQGSCWALELEASGEGDH